MLVGSILHWSHFYYNLSVKVVNSITKFTIEIRCNGIGKGLNVLHHTMFQPKYFQTCYKIK